MIDASLKVTIMGEEKKIMAGTTFEDIAKEYQPKFNHPIVVAKEKGIFKELSEVIEGNSEIEFFDCSDCEGNRIYLNGLVYLLIYSVKELYGKNTKVNVRYTIDKGLYITLNKKLSKDMIKEIKNKMLELVEQDIKKRIKFHQRNLILFIFYPFIPSFIAFIKSPVISSE